MSRRKPGLKKKTELHTGVTTRSGRRKKLVGTANGISVPKKRKEPKNQELPLKKSGKPWVVKIAKSWERELRDLSEEEPDNFRALLSLVEGRPEAVTKRQLRELREWGYVKSDYSPLPEVKRIFEAACRQTPDGLVIVDSIDVQNPQDAATYVAAMKQLERGREQRLKWLIEWLRKRGKDDRRNKDHER